MDLGREISISGLLPARLARPRGSRSGTRGRYTGTGGARGLVGLEIGSSLITAVQIVDDRGRKVVRAARAPLPPGIVDGGEVHDPEALGRALADLFSGASLPRRGVWLGIANERVAVRTIEIAGSRDNEQLRNAITFHAHETLSVSPGESIIDYHVISTRPGEDGELIRKVVVVVAYRETVERYLAATDLAKIELAGIDFEAFALLRAVAPEPSEPEGDLPSSPLGGVVIMDVGRQRTVLAVSDGHACRFARVLPWGECSIESLLLGTPGDRTETAAQLIEGLVGDPEGPESAGIASDAASRAHAGAHDEIQRLAGDVLSSLRFYQAQPDSLAINEILVSGVATAIPGFAAALSKELGISVAIADPLVSAPFKTGVPLPGVPGSLVVPIGLGIHDRPVAAVNLLPEHRRSGKGQRAVASIAARPLLVGAFGATAVAVTALALLASRSESDIATKRAQLATVRAQLAALPKPKPVRASGVPAALASRLATVSLVAGARVSWDGLLDAFARAIPDDVWLVSLSAALPTSPLASAGEATPAGAGGVPDVASTSAFKISGYTYSQPSVARLMKQLRLVPWFERVSLVTSSKSVVGDQTLYQFTLAADLVTATGAGS